MTLNQVMTELKTKGKESHKRTFIRHGAKEPLFGVPISELKIIHKKIKGNQALAMELYSTGNSDAMYLAGMVADGKKMTPAQLQNWVEKAPWYMISGTTVPWVTSEHPDAIALALKWIDSPAEGIACSGWCTLSAIVATVPDDQLPIKQLSALLDRVVKTMKSSLNRVRYCMNGYVISVGTYVEPLADKAMATARKIGHVECDMGDTACEVPEAESYILKSRRGAPVAKKRKTVRC